eukprot:jgi/Orpsp1_1/1192887/evm.model.d7180000096682.1
MKCIGIHKAGIEKKELNIATELSILEYALRTLYNKNYLYRSNARKYARELSDTEKKELEDHGLQETFISNLYYCPYYNSSNVMLFYRTNHAWYFTSNKLKKIKNIDDNIGKIMKYFNRLKNYKWILIDIYESFEHIMDNFDEKYEKRHEVIIKYLKYSELMY